VRSLLVTFILLVMPQFAAAGPSFWQTATPDAAARREIAHEWLVQMRKLDHQVPTLSPSQRQWLQTERDDEINRNGGVYTKRALAAEDSLEYQIAVVRPKLSEIEDILTTLESGRAAGPKEEAFSWSQLAAALIDHSFWQSVTSLVRRGVVEQEVIGVTDLYFENACLRAEAVLRRAVLPLLLQVHHP
jgi:hypothetical protein